MYGRALHRVYSQRWPQSDNLNWDAELMLLEPDTLLTWRQTFLLTLTLAVTEMTLLTLTQCNDRTCFWPFAPIVHRLTGVPSGYNQLKPAMWLKSTLLSVLMLFCHEIMNCLWKVQTYCHQYVDTLDEGQSLFSDMTIQEVYLFLSFFFLGGGGEANVYDLLSPFECGFYRRVFETSSRGIFCGSFAHTNVILMLWETRKLKMVVWRSLWKIHGFQETSGISEGSYRDEVDGSVGPNLGHPFNTIEAFQTDVMNKDFLIKTENLENVMPQRAK
jgi:hypothetical protein